MYLQAGCNWGEVVGILISLKKLRKSTPIGPQGIIFQPKSAQGTTFIQEWAYLALFKKMVNLKEFRPIQRKNQTTLHKLVL